MSSILRCEEEHGMDGWRLVNMYNRPGFLAGEGLGMECR